MTPDELNDALSEVFSAMRDHPALAPLMEDKLKNLQAEWKRRSAPPAPAQPPAVVHQSTPEAAAALAPAAAPAAAPQGGAAPRLQPRAAELPAARQRQWREKMLRRVLARHADLCADVDKVIDPKEVINHVTKATCKDQGDKGKQPTASAKQVAKKMRRRAARTNHLVIINGDIQRGKTNVKALESAVVWEINHDDEVCDKPFSVIVTVMVPWAQQLKNGIAKATSRAKMSAEAGGEEGDTDASEESSSAESDESDSAEDEPEEVEDLELVADPSDADDPFADGMPRMLLQTVKDLNQAIGVAMEGGAVVLPRSKGALQKAVALIHLVNAKAKSEKGGVARWPLLALDECDKMPGTCASALGKNQRNRTSRAPAQYEQLVNLLAGFEDLSKKQAVRVAYDSRTFTAISRPSKSTHCVSVTSSSANMPFLVTAISGTNAGYFAWALNRQGMPHKTDQDRDVLSLLDTISFRAASDADYRGSTQSTKFENMVLEDKEVGTANLWTCQKTIAMESVAMSTPGSCLMSCTTNTVNEGTKCGVSLQRVHYEHQVRLDLGARLGASACGHRVGRSPGGQWFIGMHGGEKAFAGKLGVEHSSPSDPMGTRKLWQFEGLCAHNAEKARSHHDWCKKRLEKLDPGSRRYHKLQFQLQEYGQLAYKLEESRQAFRVRRAAADRQQREYLSKMDATVAACEQAKEAKAAHEVAYARRMAAGQLTDAQRDALEKQVKEREEESERARVRADELLTSLIQHRHRASTSMTGKFMRSAFGQELLLPLLYIWERDNKARHTRLNPNGTPYPLLVKLPPAENPQQSMLGTAHISALLGFLRSLDCECMLGSLGPEYWAQSPEERSFDAPLKIVGMGMIRRAMTILGAWINEHGKSEVLSTVSHVVQYSNHDGASQAQQILRFATTATSHNTGLPVQVLTSERGWIAIEGHRAYNEMPEWRQSADAREQLIERMFKLTTGEEALARMDPDDEVRVMSMLREEIAISKKESIDPTHQDVRVMRIMMQLFDVPRAFARMCRFLQSPLFAGTAGREYGAMFHRARQAQRSLGPGGDDDDQDMIPPASAAKKKKRNRGTGLVDDWCLAALRALKAHGLANAVTHGQIWDTIEATHKHLLDDPAESEKLQRENPSAYKLVKRENRQGGVGHNLTNLTRRGGTIGMLHYRDERNPGAVNLYYLLSEDDPAPDNEPAVQPAPSSSSSAAGSSDAHMDDAALFGEEEGDEDEDGDQRVEIEVPGANSKRKLKVVVTTARQRPKRELKAPEWLAPQKMGGPSTIPYASATKCRGIARGNSGGNSGASSHTQGEDEEPDYRSTEEEESDYRSAESSEADEGSDDEGSDDEGSDDEGSDDEGSDDEGSESMDSDYEQ
jgi:hypothetical protein